MVDQNAVDAQVFPIAWVELDARRMLWVIEVCPILGCGRRHTHGAGAGKINPARLLSHRAGHCGFLQSGYVLRDMYPQRTAQLVAARGLQ
jgi:hypothetical protein